MLAQTIRNNLQSIKKLEMKRNKNKFSSLFHTQPVITIEESSTDELLSNEKIADFINEINDDMCEISIVEDSEDMEDFIVENPDEMVVDFSTVQKIELTEKLPFFKSITAKLACVYN